MDHGEQRAHKKENLPGGRSKRQSYGAIRRGRKGEFDFRGMFAGPLLMKRRTDMVWKKRLPILGPIILAGLLLSACTGASASITPEAGGGITAAPATETPPAAAVTPASAEAVYKMGIFVEPTSANFWQAMGPDNTVWNAYVLLPMRLSLYGLSDQRNQLILSAAGDWASPITAEGDHWFQTVPLKKGITWSDGTDFTAKDVAFTINTILKFGLVAGNWQSWVDYNYVDSAAAADDTTVKIIYHAKPGIARTDWGVLQMPILCEHFWSPKIAGAAAPLEGLVRPAPDADPTAYLAKVGDAQKALFAIDPSGEPLAGAFLFSKWEKGAYLQSLVNPNYFFRGAEVTEYADGAYHESKTNLYDFTAYGDPSGDKVLDYSVGPYVKYVQYIVYGDQNAALLALQKGDVDYVLNPQGLAKGLADQVKNDPKLTVVQNPSLSFRFLAFNTRRAPMGDAAFRQAFATIIDKEFVTHSILQGVAFPVNSFVPASNTAWYDNDVPKWGYNPDGSGMTREQRIAAAIDILVKAGYTWQGGKKPAWDPDSQQVVSGGALIMPNGKPVPALELLAPSESSDPMRSTFALWIGTWAGEMGIPVNVKLTGFNVIIPKVFSEQNFDLFMLGSAAGIFPSYLRDFWHSDQAVPGGNNAGGYASKEFDTLSDQLLTCESYDSCRAIANRIQILVATDVPWIALFDTGIYEAYGKNLAYPYTTVIGGLQAVYGMPWAVKIK
jgi:peptide/nickel transport system substrate-binding protein